MRKVLVVLMLSALLLTAWTPAGAGRAEEFAKIRILDDVMVFVDVDGGELDAGALRAHAIDAFKDAMGGMEVNNDAVVDNYPAAGYELANVGYIIIKIMSIQTEGGLNVYHLGFEFGIPPRLVYWDTATMGVGPTHVDLRKEVLEDIDEVMRTFASDFRSIRGE